MQLLHWRTLTFFLLAHLVFVFPSRISANPIIGVMVGTQDTVSGDPSSAEKACIIQALQERNGGSFRFYGNDRSRRGSAEAAQRMVEDNVDLALLPLISDETIAAVPILKNAGIPYITSATSESVLRSPEDGLGLFPENNRQARFLAELYVNKYSRRPLAVVIDESSAYSKQLSAQFIAQLHILDSSHNIQVYNVVGDSLRKIPNMSGYVVFAALFNPKIALLYRQMREDGDVILLGGDSIGVRKEFLQIVGKSSERDNAKLIFLKNWDGIPKGKNTDEFWSIFYQGCSSQDKPTFINAYVYDMATLALEWAKSNPHSSIAESVKLTERESIIDGKRFTVSKTGFLDRGYFLFQYDGGEDATPTSN